MSCIGNGTALVDSTEREGTYAVRPHECTVSIHPTVSNVPPLLPVLLLRICITSYVVYGSGPCFVCPLTLEMYERASDLYVCQMLAHSR